MKIKNISVTLIRYLDKERVILVKEVPLASRLMDAAFNTGQPNVKKYREVFTKTGCSLNPQNVLPLGLFLESTELKEDISKKELHNYYCKNEQQLTDAFQLKKRKIGFR